MNTGSAAPAFGDIFEVVFSYAFETDSYPKKRWLGDRGQRRCRFCDSKSPVFRGESHVIPAGLGNRSLFSLEECADCNDPWGSDLEDHLAKYLFLTRAVARIRKRKGGVKYKRTPESKASISSSPDENLVRVEIEAGDDSVKMEDLGNNAMLLTAHGQPYSPMKAVKALARLGIFVLDAPDYDRCAHVVRWLRGQVEYKPYFIRAFIPGTGRRLVRLRVYRRRGSDSTVAPFVVHLSYASVDLIVPFPEASFDQPALPVAPFPGFSPYPPHIPSATRISVLSDEVVQAPSESVTLRYRSKREMGDPEVVEERPTSSEPQQAGAVAVTPFPPEAFEAGVRGHVDVVLADSAGHVLFQAPATIALEHRDAGAISVKLQGERVPWSLDVPLAAGSGSLTFDTPSKQGASIPAAAEVFDLEYGLRHATQLEALDRGDHAPILYSDYNAPALNPTEAKDLEDLRKLFARLLIIEQAFPGIVRIPAVITPGDVRTIEFLSSAVEVGEFEDTPRPTYSVPMNTQSMGFLDAEFAEGRSPQGLKAPVHAIIRLFDVDLNPGPWFVSLVRPRLTQALPDLIAALRDVPATEMMMVEMAADQCIMSFERFLRDETQASSREPRSG